MADYMIVNGELYHHGVKGMKWGVHKRRDLKVAKRFAKVGKKRGAADFYREQGNTAYKKHNENAAVLEKTAKKYEQKGSYIKAQAARKAAEAVRARGENIRASNYATADKYMKKADKLNQKASAYATKKRVDLGKKKIDYILKESAKKGYNREKRFDEIAKESNLRDKLGDNGYDAYNKIRGK